MKASVWIRGALCVGALIFAAKSAKAQSAYGVDSGGVLYSFNLATPTVTTTIGTIPAVPMGIDFNPANGLLYAFYVNGGTASLYTVSTTNASRSLIGSFSTTLSATANYGLDFNPKTLQTDGSIRIRVASTNADDLRLNSATGQIAATDPALTFSTGTGTPSINAVAYTNNLAATAGTTSLFYLDNNTSSLYTSASPNTGVLTLVGTLGLTLPAVAGFDIYTAADGTTNTAYLVANANTATVGSELYTVNLATGATALASGTIGANLNIVKIAIVPLPVPEPSTYAMLGLGAVALAFGWMRRRNAGATA